MSISNKRKFNNIVLDIDHTLIHAIDLGTKGVNKHLRVPKKRMGNFFMIYYRPYLQVFLKYLFRNFNVGIWSAGSRDYVEWIVTNIILDKHPDRHLDFVLNVEHCDISENKYGSLKDLRYVWEVLQFPNYFPQNTLLIDDLNDNLFSQSTNSIHIPVYDVFSPSAHKDDALMIVLLHLDLLRDIPDMRDVHLLPFAKGFNCWKI